MSYIPVARNPPAPKDEYYQVLQNELKQAYAKLDECKRDVENCIKKNKKIIWTFCKTS